MLSVDGDADAEAAILSWMEYINSMQSEIPPTGALRYTPLV